MSDPGTPWGATPPPLVLTAQEVQVLIEWYSVQMERAAREGHSMKVSHQFARVGTLVAEWDRLRAERKSVLPKRGESLS